MYRWQSNTPVSEPDVQELLDIRAALVELSFHVKLLQLREAIRKAGFNPNQPRVPRNNPHGGRWAGPGGSGTAPSGSKPVTSPRADPQLPPRGEGDPPRIIITPRTPEIGHNGGPPLEDPPIIPREAPPTAQDRMRVVRRAAGWLLRAMRYGPGPQAKLFAAAVEATVWIADLFIPHITAYLEPPKTLAELQAAVDVPTAGTDVHHIVEQTAAAAAGYPQAMIDGRENLVRISRLKHWEISAWYQRPNRAFGQLSPREYLKDNDWAERQRVGIEALVEHGVLKP